MFNQLKGVGAALVTPFTENGNVDYDGLGRLLRYTAEGGVDYYVVHGTTGESVTTTAKEKADIFSYIRENNHKNLPIVYGLGGNNTSGLIEEMKALDLEGVDAILSVSPAYCLPTQEGLYQHYKAIADASPKPIILYNVPGRTSKNLEASTTLRLAGHENIIGIKEACKDLTQSMEIASRMPKDFILISGDDLLTIPMITFGGAGVISVLANGLPSQFCKMVHGALSGNFVEAKEALFKVLQINNLLYCEGNPVGIKQVLTEVGVCEPHVRLPLVKASSKLARDLKEGLSHILTLESSK